ncbi:hypothetical protein GCM10007385_19650 [Tateyamaria omphalii]|uniref:hypothetical protein n=1 Tax=Tateyamaria omphalii TaxID=299262 RepID=UPI001676FBB9|nr:hypothetical protein [Tateyamaria omphalii]GGX51144.1 hypothetical protein GCM10007385_19650 [Tateyamaria omphalii]
MRILGLGLLAILFLALARFVLIQPDVQGFVGLRGGDGRIHHDLVSKLPSGTQLENAQGTQHTFIVRESDTWTALAGSPGFASASFNMPKEVSVVSGELILDVRAELQADSVARMRVNVNGERRGEIILSQGVNSNTIRINLLPSDLTQSQLVVSLGAFGTFPNQSCRRDWNGGMIVRIEPTSRIEIETEGPLLDLNDRLRATGNPYHIAWPNDPAVKEYERLISFAVDQNFRDIRTIFVPADATSVPAGVSFSSEDLSTAAMMMENAVRDVDDVSWPLPIALEGTIAEARYFEYDTSWRHNYDLRTTPNAEYPTALSFGLRAIGLQPDAEWLLTVTLNDAIVFAEKFEGASLDLNRTVELPLLLHDFSNILEIRLISSERQNQEFCTSGSPITAQLKQSTVLRGGVAAEDKTIGQFINALNGPLHLEVSEQLNAAEASTAVPFLAEAFGDRVQWVSDQNAGPDDDYVLLNTRSELKNSFERIRREWPDHTFWLISPRLFDQGELPYRQTELTDISLLDFELNEGPRIAAIVAIKPAPQPIPNDLGSEAADDAEAVEENVLSEPTPATVDADKPAETLLDAEPSPVDSTAPTLLAPAPGEEQDTTNPTTQPDLLE